MSRNAAAGKRREKAGRSSMHTRPFFFVFLLATTSGAALAAQAATGVLDAFDFSKEGGVRRTLPRSLEEISGLAVDPEGRVFSHNDERAVFYELDPSSGEVLHAFSAGAGGVRGDFEGIAAVGERLFLVTSSGELLETAAGDDGSAMSYRLHEVGLRGVCEFEGLAYDPRSASLLLPCKKTNRRAFEDHLVVLEVKLDPLRTYLVPRIFIPFAVLEAAGLKAPFHPSGIEVHPGTGRTVLISAQEESILEVSGGGSLLDGHQLRRKSHPQPEGITFLPDGSLLLADEGQGKRGSLTLYRARTGAGGNWP